MLPTVVLLGLATTLRASPSSLNPTHCAKDWDTGQPRIVMPGPGEANNVAITTTQIASTSLPGTYASSGGASTIVGNVVAGAGYRWAVKVDDMAGTFGSITGGADATQQVPVPGTTCCGYQKNKDNANPLTSELTLNVPEHGGDVVYWLATAMASGSAGGDVYTAKYTITDTTTCSTDFTTTDIAATVPTTTAGSKAGTVITFTCNSGKEPSDNAICSKGTWTAPTCVTVQYCSLQPPTGVGFATDCGAVRIGANPDACTRTCLSSYYDNNNGNGVEYSCVDDSLSADPADLSCTECQANALCTGTLTCTGASGAGESCTQCADGAYSASGVCTVAPDAASTLGLPLVALAVTAAAALV